MCNELTTVTLLNEWALYWMGIGEERILNFIFIKDQKYTIVCYFLLRNQSK